MKEQDRKNFSTIDSETLMDTPLDNRIIFLLSEFTKERTAFIGTPTELASAIDPVGNEGISPKTVSRQILQNTDALNKIGISAVIRRSNGKRLIELHRADSADAQSISAVDPVDPAAGYGYGNSSPSGEGQHRICLVVGPCPPPAKRNFAGRCPTPLVEAKSAPLKTRGKAAHFSTAFPCVSSPNEDTEVTV